MSLELAQWRAARYSDVRYKLNLTLEKMSPVLKGTIEIRVKVGARTLLSASPPRGESSPIILDWRKIAGYEKDSTITKVTLNGSEVQSASFSLSPDSGQRAEARTPNYQESNDHLIFREGVVAGENVIKLDFTSPILTSGSAITRYVDKEDGAEYLYSLFVPSDASTAFPVFDQPDMKARFKLLVSHPKDWVIIANSPRRMTYISDCFQGGTSCPNAEDFEETKPISTYVFAFAAGPFEAFEDKGGNASGNERVLGPDKDATSPTPKNTLPTGRVSASDATLPSHIYVRKSQAAKFKPHAAEVFRLNREGIKYLETYFDYKFPFPKYDIVLIPEFPFGGMEHAGATFLREASIIFPTEPTKSDYISRANLIFHETAHQWFGDTVTMKWFDDLWLKEGFAEFMAYKTLEHVMPDANAWKVFYERNKQAAYATDSTKGTTPIYQKIDNLSAAKSAYGNIVYRKAPSFLRQAEFYLGEDKFQTAVRAFLKKHEYANAGWEDLVKEFETASTKDLKQWGNLWIKQKGVPKVRTSIENLRNRTFKLTDNGKPTLKKANFEKLKFDMEVPDERPWDPWLMSFKVTYKVEGKETIFDTFDFYGNGLTKEYTFDKKVEFVFPNYQDYGYGIFLLDAKSRDYVLKNIQNEKDPFLRSMMWGSLWDSVREGELDPKVYVELVIKNLGVQSAGFSPSERDKSRTLNAGETDETIIQSLLARVGTAMNYYMPDAAGSMQKPAREQGLNTRHPSKALANARASATDDVRARLEAVLLDRLQHAPAAGQRITYYRAFVSMASTDKGRDVLKQMLRQGGNASGNERVLVRDDGSTSATPKNTLPTGRVSASSAAMPLRTKDKFDIVARLIILGDPEATALLTGLEKTEAGDDARRYAYAARAGTASAASKAKYWNDYVKGTDISESWIESSLGSFNSVRQIEFTLPYLEKALAELPTLKRTRKIFLSITGSGPLSAASGARRPSP
ncbi:MAG: M1 family metallopeptidase [Pyrinomonadaceae bacterium]